MSLLGTDLDTGGGWWELENHEDLNEMSDSADLDQDTGYEDRRDAANQFGSNYVIGWLRLW